MDIKIYKSNRKTISLSVDDDLNAVVRAPYGVSDKEINELVSKNKLWLERASERKRAQLEKNNLCEDEIKALIKTAKEIIPERVEYFSALMNLYPTGIKITRAKKRFGSCNAKNSVCFSCFLMNYPMKAVDYVVVHELAHIRYHNHGRNFYNLISHYMPDYKQREKLLKS